MSQRFETKRLILRSFEEGDLDNVYEQIYSDEEVVRYYGPLRTHEGTCEWLTYRILEARFSECHAWAVIRKEDEQFLGLARLGAGPNDVSRLPEEPLTPFNPLSVELSFAFGKVFWGNGYATEACKPIIEYAFKELKLPRLMGGVHRDNQRSIDLHHRLGFRVVENAHPDYQDELVAVLENDLV